MQFTHQGPDIADRLLQAHDDGRVVFVCSEHVGRIRHYPPWRNDSERFLHICHCLGLTPSAAEQAALSVQRPDTAWGLLETRLPNGRITVRTALAQVLVSAKPTRGGMAILKTLLALAAGAPTAPTCPQRPLRLITTAVDARLDRTIGHLRGLQIARHTAPTLPRVDADWSGVVYLHGQLLAQAPPAALAHLTLSHLDLAQAYQGEALVGRWMRDLLRQHVVCLVGFTPEDPVIRHWTAIWDALQAEDALPGVFAFSPEGARQRQRHSPAQGWVARGVEPLPYRDSQGQQVLRHTLTEWARQWQSQGGQRRTHIVALYAHHGPTASTRQDNVTARMLWALNEPSGQAALRFANTDPLPPLAWLDALGPTCFGADFLQGRWQEFHRHLARWWCRHLHDPRLALWAAQQAHPLPEMLVALIRKHLVQAPSAPPSATALPDHVNALWHLLLSQRVVHAATASHHTMAAWYPMVRHFGLTPALRFMLRDALSPCVALQASSHALPQTTAVTWRLLPKAPRAAAELSELWKDPGLQGLLADLLGEATTVLRDTLDMMTALSLTSNANAPATAQATPSCALCPADTTDGRPSPWQEWTVFIDWARHAWLACAQADRAQARRVAEHWRQQRHPVFSRLVLVTATMRPDVLTPPLVLNWLTDDDHGWLWHDRLLTEVLDWLQTAAAGLDEEHRHALEATLLLGPPQAASPQAPSPEDPRHAAICARLHALQSAGISLTAQAQAILTPWLEAQTPPEGADTTALPCPLHSPSDRQALLEWVRRHPSAPTGTMGDDWLARCRKDFWATALCLIELSRNQEWPHQRWREALQAWGESPSTLERSWRCMTPVLHLAPTAVLQSLSFTIGQWLRRLIALPATLDDDPSEFLALLAHVMQAVAAAPSPHVPGVQDDPVIQAAYHPAGQLAHVALQWWLNRQPADGEGLPPALAQWLRQLCEDPTPSLRTVRTLLGSHVIALFRTDPQWTQTHLLPWFNWATHPQEAANLWKGLLRSPAPHAPLMHALHVEWAQTAEHAQALGADWPTYQAWVHPSPPSARPQRTDTEPHAPWAMTSSGTLPAEGTDHA